MNPTAMLWRHRVTHWTTVPAILHELLRFDATSFCLASLRYLASSGDVLDAKTAARLRSLLQPDAVLLSMCDFCQSPRSAAGCA